MGKNNQNNFPIINLNKDDLKELGDRIIQAFKDIQEKRKQITQKTSEEILKTELENLKALADRQIANEKTVLDLKLANAKKLPDRSKLKIDEAKKELDIKTELINKSFDLEYNFTKEQKKNYDINSQDYETLNNKCLELDKNRITDKLKQEEEFKNQKLKITQEETEQIKKKYETTFSTIGKTITKISTVLDGNLGKTFSNLGTAIEKIGTTIASGKKLTLTEALTSSVDFITNTVQVYKNGNKSVSGWDLINNTLNGAMLGSQIGSAIPVVGSTIGAVAGAGVDFASTIFGWIFGGGARKLQRELTTIGQINDMVTKNLSALSSRTNQLASTAGSGNFLDELQGQIGQIKEQLGYISGQGVYAL